jgi:hypothetical protein
MMRGRGLASANVMLRAYAQRPGVATAAGIATGLARNPLMRFFQDQTKRDAERHKGPQSMPMVMPHDRGIAPSTQSAPQDPYGTQHLFSQRRTTGFDNRPFSEPVRYPEPNYGDDY